MKISNSIRPKTRKRRMHRMWSRPRRPLPSQEYLHLPTRETLTYAEAQKFVDIETNGEIHRLNINEPLEFVSEAAFLDKAHNFSEDVSACPAVSSVSLTYTEDSCSMPAISHLPQPVVKIVESFQIRTLYKRQASYFRNIEKTQEELNEEIEYDMDEEDMAWLKRINELRHKEKLVALSHDNFEAVVDRLEKEAYLLTVEQGSEFRSSEVQCEICMDNESQSLNVILRCDMCSMAVHQDCYGVPFLPEGEWLCKKCLKSPNVPVVCCLCPVKEGPLKQTDDGRWAHVLCAFWIPEVGFGNAIYLEPVDKISKVPESRFILKCDICKIQGVGACIKCHLPGCNSSFHATCAMKSGLFMKMEAVPENGSRMNYRKTFFCNEHRPVGASLYQSGISINNDDDASRTLLLGSDTKASNRSKFKKSKKAVAELLYCQPIMPVPTIPSKRLIAIADYLNVRDRRQIVARLHSYWLLKRQSRNGYPLIQRLHSTLDVHCLQSREQLKAGVDENILKFLKKLRQDLEKVRLLLELIRKREKLKYECVKLQQMILNLQLLPFAILLTHTLDQLQAKDPNGIFAFPVPVLEVPDYLERISHPMDFSTMRGKIRSHIYRTVDDFETDFRLIVDNCLTYNQAGSFLYKIGLKLKEQGSIIIAAARRMSQRADYCIETGLHNTDFVFRNRVKCLRSSKSACYEENLELRLKELLKCLDVLQVVRSVRNALLAKRLKKEIAICKRKLTLCRQDQKTTDQKNCQLLHNDYEHHPQGRTRNYIHGHFQLADLVVESSAKNSLVTDRCSPKLPLESLFADVVVADNEDSADKQPNVCNRQDFFRMTKEALASPVLAKDFSDIKVVSDLNVCISLPLQLNTQLNEMLFQPDLSIVTTRSASRRMSLAGQDTDNNEIRQTMKRQLSVPINNSSHQHHQRTCGRFHMIAQPISVVESKEENDSSYESSYSVLSDSELSKCNSPDSQNGGPFFIAKKRSGGYCSAEALDTQTPLHPKDVVWAKSKGYPWYPAMIINPNANPENDRLKIAPPNEVLALRPRCQEPVYLIRFFDKRHNWQWLPRNKLEPLGVNNTFDTLKIMEIKQCKLRSDIRRAFEEAKRFAV